MTPPKRALFSLNLDSDIDHLRQRIEERNLDGSEKPKIIETRGHSDLSFVGKPIENIVNKAVDSVVDGTGKTVRSVDGDITYSHSETRNSNGKAVKVSSSNSKKGRSIWEKYDTSEL
ncbi:hypothetical protein P153DRAFT_389893 [Dothidotthia symphoricarpi CBS 119687]|uniref:Uncharacterized protein n=1 Tax=Dothidotthia symphoricarpi CBS 119687 TaxID=1392245 RepID=A0A6A6A2S5_9PLEO|nr:uncharacterized protein P153DRAFT_389893 [Dothidotthia symphoricarpi CBS 119687]KAF2125038.1 hypothetical protein P153DRAFT_389893 [Dothidotthia symphoricarpi CBS 119687]